MSDSCDELRDISDMSEDEIVDILDLLLESIILVQERFSKIA